MTWLGVSAAVALCTAIPLYTDTVYNRLLQNELTERRRGQPPFNMMFRYSGTKYGACSWADLQPVDDYLRRQIASALRLPSLLTVRYVKTDDFAFYASESGLAAQRDPVALLSFATQSDFEGYVTLVEGRFPVATASAEGRPVEVLLSEQLAYILQWQVGETFIAFAEQGEGDAVQAVQTLVQVVGIWRAIDRHDPYWFINPTKMLADMLLVSEATFAQQLGDLLHDEVSTVIWYLIFDGAAFRPGQAEAFLHSLEAVQIRANTLLPNTEMVMAPAASALRRYQTLTRWLTVSLFALSTPILAVIVVFLNMVIALSVRRQHAEIALLRSRGASEKQVLSLAVIQGIGLASLALILGLPAGQLTADGIARARGFLVFSHTTALQTTLTLPLIRLGGGVASLALLGLLLYTREVLSHTVVSYRWARARTLRAPWWQRAWVDILLAVVAVYGVYLLYSQSGISPARIGEEPAAEVIRQNPLLFGVPSLTSLALTLLLLRGLPYLFAVVEHGVSVFPGAAILLALRRVARNLREYSVPLVLLMLTLSLAVFTASLAYTLDLHASERAYRQIGADMNLVEMGENTEAELEMIVLEKCNRDPTYPCPRDSSGNLRLTEADYANFPRWRFVPLAEHLRAPGVQAAARIGRYTLTIPGQTTTTPGVYLGIDRVEFTTAAFWRAEYASLSLGALMNTLAYEPNQVLVSREFAEQRSLRRGDTVQAIITVPEYRRTMQYRNIEVPFVIASIVDGFPSWVPDQGPLFVGNLDYLFQEAGGQYPYDVWLKTNTATDPESIVKAVRALGINVQTWDAPAARLQRAQARPEYQGSLGMLSAGFLVSAALTMLGVMLYMTFSFRQRALEVGMLRAIGFSRGQVIALIAWELASLIFLGALGGTGIGLGLSYGLIPYLPLGIETSGLGILPSVVIAWRHVIQVYGLLLILFVGMSGVLAWLLRRLRLFEAIKLGDAV